MKKNLLQLGISSLMNIFIVAGLVLSTFFGPVSTAAAAPAQAPLYVNTGSISGTVTEQATGNPLSGVEICRWDYDTGNNFTCTSTIANGTYTLAGLASGNYRIRAHKSGWSWQFYNNTTQWNNAAQVSVVDGQSTTGINFAMKPGGTISGYVRNAGTPLGGILVEVVRSNGTGWPTCTDSNGYYEFDNVPYDVAWRVQASGNGYNQCSGVDNYAQQFWNHTASWDAATTLTVNLQSSSYSNINFDLELGGSISGTVRNESNNPIQNVQVCANEYDSDNNVDCVQSGSNGNYLIEGLSAGDYRIEARADGWAREYYNNTFSWSSANRVSVTAGSTTSNINFVLEPGGSISGHVYQANGVTPIANMNVSLDGPGFGNGTCTDQNGAYTLNNAAYGIEWRVRAAPGGDNWCGGSEGYASEYWQETISWESATTLTLSAGTPNYNGINFTLAPGGSVSGHIYETDGVTPVDNAEVVIFINDVSQSIMGVTADEQGYYIFNGIATGNNIYKIHARADGYLRAFHPDVASWGDAAWVSVQAGQTTPGVDIKLIEADSYITGRTTYEDGSPAAYAWMEAFHKEDGWFVGINANENGEFTIPVIEGDWQVFPHELPLAAVEQSVSVTTGATVSGINFILHPTGSISGIVSDGTTPIANMALSLITATQEEGGWACSDANGQFTFEDVPYRVQWRVSAVPSWRCTGEPEGYVHEYWQGAHSWDDATVITLSDSMPNYDSIVFTLDQGETTSGVIGATGGSVLTPGENVSISVPPGSISSDIAFTITDGGSNYQVATSEDDLNVIMSTIIGPEGTTFANPATLTFKWLDTNNDGIVDGTVQQESHIILIKDGLVITPACAVNPSCNMASNTLTVQVNSLSLFELAIPVNQPPVADAGGPYFANEGTTINLSASKSTDPDNKIVLYEWDLDNDGEFDDATGKKPKFKAIDNGVFIVQVRVTDAGGLSSVDDATLTVRNVPPVIKSFSINSVVRAGSQVNARVTFKDAGVNDTFTATWNWGDGSTSNGTVSGYTVSGTHIYTKAGFYVITLTVKDKDEGIGKSTARILVLPKR